MANAKIKLDIQFKDMTGENFNYEDGSPVCLGKAIAQCLLNNSEVSDAQRAYVLAMDFSKNKEIELNSSDMTFVKETIKGSRTTTLIKGQALDILSRSEVGETEQK